jgi:flagellar biosynthetic protein FliR
MDIAAITANQIQAFILIFIRIVTMVALMPVLGSQNIPTQIKIGLAFVIAVVIYPAVIHNGFPAFPTNTGIFIVMLIKESFTGIIIGYVASLLFTIIQFAGYLVDSLAGFTFVELVDPSSDSSVSVFGQFNIIIFTVMFLLFNGHYFLLLAIQKSFEVIPLLGAHIPIGKMMPFLIKAVGSIFVLGFKFAAPVYVTLLLTQVSMGVVAKTAPQINVYFVGIPLNIIIAFSVTVIVFPGLATMFKKMIDMMTQDIWRLIYMMA